MTELLTIQAFVGGEWRDAAKMAVLNPAKVEEGRVSVGYELEYGLDFPDSIFEPALTLNMPVSFNTVDTLGYPAFVYDIIPAGAARKSLEARFGGDKPDGMDMEFFLLRRCTPAPIGNLRVKESVESLAPGLVEAFTRQEVVDRTNAFLEYAYEAGAALGGATGAQGQAPKLVMTEGLDGALYADAMIPDEQVARHWLIKFARNKVTERDKDILRTEYHYYRAIAELGLETVPVDGLALEEGRNPSLWMPRFDRRVVDGGVERLPLESVYSVCNVTTPGAYMQHEVVIRTLVAHWQNNGQGDEVDDLIFEYVRRDLLNRILGNSDNHGRNTAIIREAERFRLAPIYDLAPMILDEEGVTRVTKWHYERVAAPMWEMICAELGDLTQADVLYGRLVQAAHEFRALPDLLAGIPEGIRAAASLPLNNLDARLAEWGLI
ncbi:serine/threonine-protein kinase HipA [Pseudomonas nitritireducens]|uniref:Serine/threonine-protein kinase HipA n=1 Tax=Pseudomonas nitroreducens TaxID=46680 RepID=A0A7W7KF46_PSENT|nr:HipA domain-containing protein [Pseudomonas nitritireducens]MBB4861707.1 serine/threonine-protein kinase HipA [Pseudomonas nitritireducens]